MDTNLTPVVEDVTVAEILHPQFGGGGARTMSFFDAMRKIKDGDKVTRISWNNDDYCFLKDGWLSIFTAKDFHTWTINDGDMDGEDWILVGEGN